MAIAITIFICPFPAVTVVLTVPAAVALTDLSPAAIDRIVAAVVLGVAALYVMVLPSSAVSLILVLFHFLPPLISLSPASGYSVLFVIRTLLLALILVHDLHARPPRVVLVREVPREVLLNRAELAIVKALPISRLFLPVFPLPAILRSGLLCPGLLVLNPLEAASEALDQLEGVAAPSLLDLHVAARKAAVGPSLLLLFVVISEFIDLVLFEEPIVNVSVGPVNPTQSLEFAAKVFTSFIFVAFAVMDNSQAAWCSINEYSVIAYSIR